MASTRCTSREWAHTMEHIFLEASVLASIPDLPASPPHFPRCLLQILPTCAILPRICPYKLLQHLGKQGECKQADGRKRAGEAQPTEHLPRVRQRAQGFMSRPSLASQERPTGPRPALPCSGWVTLGRGSQLDPELLFPRLQDGAVSANIGVSAR